MNEMQTRPSKRLAISRFLGITASLAALSAAASEDCFTTSIKPYTVSVSPDYIIKPLLSAGDRVPLTGDPTKEYQMIGIPDGLGAHRAAFDRFVLYMNHELTKGTMSEPNVGGSLNRGAFVSRWLISDKGCVLSGKRAYDTIYDEEKGLMLPAPDTSNITPDFSRFCSGSLAWQEAGFDRPIYFCGEESNGAATFDGKGGLGVCIFQGSSGGELHTMPWLGRVAWENASVQPKDGRRTVLIGMEDGPSSPDSQLYLHVGQKNGSSGATVLQRNGLDAGMKTYVLVSATAGNNDEVTFQDGTIDARWIELSNVAALTDVELEAASDAVGAFGFIRTEDGAFSKTDPNVYYFVTTGGATGNTLGRLYKLELNRNNVTGPCTLRVIYNADQIIAAGGDIAISPDNMDTSADYIMINEDGTAQSRPIMASKARDGSVWRIDLKNNYAAARVAELNPPGPIPAAPVPPATLGIPPAVGAGIWETSGIIDGEAFFGRDSWIFDVQAHSPTIAPATNVVEDGQLLIMRRVFADGDQRD